MPGAPACSSFLFLGPYMCLYSPSQRLHPSSGPWVHWVIAFRREELKELDDLIEEAQFGRGNSSTRLLKDQYLSSSGTVGVPLFRCHI